MVLASPAWKPQATLAEVRCGIKLESGFPAPRAAVSPTSPFKSMRIASQYTPVISSTFLKARPLRICGFIGDFVRHSRCPQEPVSVCGLRHEAVNAGGSQAGIPGRGAFGRPILFFLYKPQVMRLKSQ